MHAGRACEGDVVEISPLCDAYGMFPEPLETVFAGSGLAGDWQLHVHCFLIRTGGATVLVDAGTGPGWAPATQWFGRPGRLLDELETLGVAPVDVTHLVLTHLHLDHVGWVVHGPADRPEPTFPQARHVVQRAELDPERLGGLYGTHVVPLLDAGLLDAYDGSAELLPGVELVPTPGHTAGHQCVRLDDGTEQLIISGDAFVHPAQVDDPAIVYVYEDDATQATHSRRSLLADATRRPMVLAPAHFAATMAMIDVADDGSITLQARATCDRDAAPITGLGPPAD
jgi:glyoxylase-like metal-dependent hydrolase (beta-lactamase superfamily II)